MDDPIATTPYGKVQGAIGDGVVAFKGVRYGADTATTRFAALAEPAAWRGVQAANADGAISLQAKAGSDAGGFLGAIARPALPMSEDCLFLNVWTPALADGGARPVMVWFHGGVFASGSGSWKNLRRRTARKTWRCGGRDGESSAQCVRLSGAWPLWPWF